MSAGEVLTNHPSQPPGITTGLPLPAPGPRLGWRCSTRPAYTRTGMVLAVWADGRCTTGRGALQHRAPASHCGAYRTKTKALLPPRPSLTPAFTPAAWTGPTPPAPAPMEGVGRRYVLARPILFARSRCSTPRCRLTPGAWTGPAPPAPAPAGRCPSAPARPPGSRATAAAAPARLGGSKG